jgi:hypothetical protein
MDLLSLDQWKFRQKPSSFVVNLLLLQSPFPQTPFAIREDANKRNNGRNVKAGFLTMRLTKYRVKRIAKRIKDINGSE